MFFFRRVQKEFRQLVVEENYEQLKKLHLTSNDINKNYNFIHKARMPALCFAAKKQNILLCQALVELGADVNKCCKEQRSSLSYASESGNKNVAKYLLLNGARPDYVDKEGRTPLFYAIMSGDSGMIKIFAENGADIDYEMSSGLTPLLASIASPDLKTMEVLLECGADPNKTSKDGKMTPLIGAASQNAEVAISILLDYGAKINFENEAGETAMLYAAAYGGLESIDILFSRGAWRDDLRPFGAALPRDDEVFLYFQYCFSESRIEIHDYPPGGLLSDDETTFQTALKKSIEMAERGDQDGLKWIRDSIKVRAMKSKVEFFKAGVQVSQGLDRYLDRYANAAEKLLDICTQGALLDDVWASGNLISALAYWGGSEGLKDLVYKISCSGNASQAIALLLILNEIRLSARSNTGQLPF